MNMSESKRKRIKKAAISWLCVAVLAAAAIPAENVGIFTPVTVYAADSSDASVHTGTIDLSQLMEYKADSSLCPAGITAELVGNSSNEYERSVVLTITQSGTYKLVGNNCINGSYVDVQIKADNNAKVNIVCDDAFIKNDNGDSKYVCSIDNYSIYNYVIPFKAENGSEITVLGKLYIDVYSNCFFGSFVGSECTDGNVVLNKFNVRCYLGDYINYDENYAISGYDYDLRDYYKDCKCLSERNSSGTGITTVNSDASIDLRTEHNYDSNNICTRCGVGTHTVTIDDGSSQQTVAVKDRDVITRPADPVNGSNTFTGWYTDKACTKLYDFTSPVTEDITIYAGWFTPVVFDGVTYDKPLNKNTIKLFYTDASGKVSFDTGNYILTGNITSDDTFALNAGSGVKLFLNGLTLAAGLDTASAAGFTVANDNTNRGQLLIKNNSTDNWTLPTDFIIAENDDAATNAKYPYALRHTRVDFELNGHGAPIASAEPQNNIAPQPAVPEESGWTFGGWYSDTALTIPFDFDNVTDICTAYAKWTEYAIDNIAVKTKPEKTDYIAGEHFDPTGLVLTVTYDNGETEDVAYTAANASEFTFSQDGALTLTDSSVTVTYGGKTAAQAITVREKAVVSVAVAAAPNKTSYTVGEHFDPTGLVLTVTYDNGETEDVAYTDANASEFTFSPDGALAFTDKSVTVTYGGKSAAVAVTVNKGAVTVKPTIGDIDGAVIDMPIDELIDAVIDNEDKKLIEQGADIGVYLSMMKINSDNVPEADKNAINSVLGDFTVGCYLDVNLFRMYSDGALDKQVTDPAGGVYISFNVPQFIINNYPEDEYVYSMFCSHNGGGYSVMNTYDAAADRMTFYSDKFSVYALGVKPIQAAPSEHSITSDSRITVSDTAKTGETVTVKVEDGYKATVTDANGNTIAVITGTGTFTMPDSDVTITSENIKPAPTVYYSVSADRYVTLSGTKYQAGDMVSYRVADFYEAVIYINGRASGRISGSGSFVMPSADVKIVSSLDEAAVAMLRSGIENSYVFSYDADMEPIKTSSTRKKNDYIIIDLGEEYSGRTFTIYKGRKSTGTKVTEGVLDANGRFRFEAAGYGKNYTLVIDD